jgi:hypothetical protein
MGNDCDAFEMAGPSSFKLFPRAPHHFTGKDEATAGVSTIGGDEVQVYVSCVPSLVPV